ncbi:MAG: HAMP domain-containing protein [Rhodobacteraceae bacterium]|nr:HAMP domain-containing protein [Paracoccaceae bacterium]MBR9820681.1 HAMP domain-containing protein [Paracoccaceae bacterium]
MARLWQRSLGVQLMASILFALIVSQFVSLAILWDYLQSDKRASAREELVHRATAVARLYEAAPAALRNDLIRISSTETSRFWVSDDEPVTLEAWVRRAFGEFEAPLGELLDEGGRRLSPSLPEDAAPHTFLRGMSWTEAAEVRTELPANARSLDFASQDGAGVIVPLGEDRWLNAAFYKALPPTLWQTHLPLSLGLAAMLVSIIGILTVRRIARPLRELTRAANMLGRGEAVPPLPERGPQDVRRTTSAFNAMQERLHRFVADRSRMLGAIGHDMRTPLTTLRLRAELVENAELQERMLSTIAEMEAMTESALALARQETETEPTRTIDLSALVESVCEDLAELGRPVRFHDGDRLTFRCRPEGLRRVVRNLAENAARYGGGAEVRVLRDSGAVRIVVDDNGPGVPVDRFEDVFAPFFRLESSRSRDTGGVGLGLAIARAIARQHGGDIHLSPRNPGLRATVVLPI